MTTENEFCSGCAQRHDCQSVYRAVGQAPGPNVVWKVIVAFLVPITVFVLSVAGFGIWLREALACESLRTAATFGLSVLVTLAAVGLIRWVGGGGQGTCDREADGNTQHGNTRKKDI